MNAAALLRTTRIRSGLTQADVARRAGTSQPVISAYERGHRDPTTGTLRQLISAAGGQLELGAGSPGSDLPPPDGPIEHAQRLHDLLLLVDAIPPRRRAPFRAPRLVSR